MLFMFFLYVLCSKYKLPRMLFMFFCTFYVANTSCRVCFLCFFLYVLCSKYKLPRMLFMFFLYVLCSKYKLPRMLFMFFFVRFM